jgi:hypothetical protein
MKRSLLIVFILLCLVVPQPAFAKDCSVTSVGLVPLNDLVGGNYEGYPGGLYAGGNNIPSQHLQSGMAASQSIQPLNLAGNPHVNGKIVLLGVGMSNARMEFQRFMDMARLVTADNVALVNGAEGGFDAPRIADPNSEYWDMIDDKLANKGLSPLQVQAVWLKEATAEEADSFPNHANQLKNYLRQVVLIIHDRYPNVETIYLSSRIYAGYATTNISDEPWAYEGGFAVKWLINGQVQRTDPALIGPNIPWLAWGPYLWADGTDARSDGLTWQCTNFKTDGVHPSDSGATKVGNKLLEFFTTHPTTAWFDAP